MYFLGFQGLKTHEVEEYVIYLHKTKKGRNIEISAHNQKWTLSLLFTEITVEIIVKAAEANVRAHQHCDSYSASKVGRMDFDPTLYVMCVFDASSVSFECYLL